MKLSAFVLLLSLFLFSTVARGQENAFVFGVSPKDTKNSKLGINMGMATLNWNFALNVIFDSEYSEKDFVDTPIPHSDFQDLGEKRIGNTIGLTVSRFFSLPENFPDLYLGGGFYSGRVSRIVKSNATGWLWSQDKKSKLDLAGEAGVVLGRQRSEKFFFGLGLNTFQGLNFNLFIKF